ncbi:STAS domain-containing protein [bacterium]|nr:STAS domain-containing protein [bacterium]
MRSALEEGRVDLVFDLGKLQYADSTALGNLVGIHMDVKKHGGRLVLCNLLPNLRSVIEKANLSRYFHILEDLGESLDNLGVNALPKQ